MKDSLGNDIKIDKSTFANKEFNNQKLLKLLLR